jgi:nicotinamidase-related amidase
MRMYLANNNAAAIALLSSIFTGVCVAGGAAGERVYRNTLVPIPKPKPILADHPEFVAPVQEAAHFEAPVLVDDPGADLAVRAWRFSYNSRGIIEIPNRLAAARTAVIVVHPWGVDDGRGWRTPEPAGCAFFCTPAKNRLGAEHTRKVVNPFLKSLRGKVGLVLYSLPGKEDPIRKKLYRSFRSTPAAAERDEGARELAEKLNSFQYSGEPVVGEIKLSAEQPVKDYFAQFEGLSAGDRANRAGFWNLPIPVIKDIEVAADDVVIYDGDGYDALRDFLKKQGIRHILLAGYCTDMCYARTTAGYENLSKDFNVFLVGDATLATFPANTSPAVATNAAISFASLNQLVTQVSWIRLQSRAQAGR